MDDSLLDYAWKAITLLAAWLVMVEIFALIFQSFDDPDAKALQRACGHAKVVQVSQAPFKDTFVVCSSGEVKRP